MTGKASLIFVIGFGVIMGYIILNLTSMGTRATENMSYYNAAAASKNLAAIGANVGLAILYEDENSVPGELENRTITTGPYSGGRFRVTAENMFPPFVMLRSVSTYPVTAFHTLRDTVEVVLRRSVEGDFPNYAWYAEAHGAGGNFFFSGDTLWGPVYKEGQFRVSGPVVFHGHVTMGGGNFSPPPNSAQFQAKLLGGHTPGAEKQSVDVDFGLLIGEAYAGGRVFEDENVTIEIAGDELKIWNQYPPSDWDNPDETITMHEFNGTVFVEGDLYVKGQVGSGYRVTFGTENNINIIGDVLYSQDPPYERRFIEHNETYELDRYEMVPKQNPQVDEILGFAAMRDIVIQSEVIDHDLFLNGIYYAQGILKVSDLNISKGTIDIWGSVLQKTAFGGLGQSWIRQAGGKGFAQQLFRFDPRVGQGLIPPGFPIDFTVGRLQIISWYESVQIPPF